MFCECLFLLLSILSVFSVKTPPEEDFYHAAVVEYCPLTGTDAFNSLMNNAKEYSSLIAEASKHADIVVFPEEGLFFFIHDHSTFIEVPFDSHANSITDSKNLHPALLLLSQAAQENNIYVVVNLKEKYNSSSEVLYYNTNVIFDRSGNIIARYRKTHLFGERLNTTNPPEHVYFDSDFGVRFGTFICFDLLFEDPALKIIKENNVTDILYPTLWFSGLPFLTAVQSQAGWAYATDVNFLASGGNSVLNANTGSGIFAGKSGPVVYLQSQWNETVILYAKVIKKGRKGTSTGYLSTPKRKGEREKLKLWGDNALPFMKSVLLTPKVNTSSTEKHNTSPEDDATVFREEFSRKLCQDAFCCQFYINASFVHKQANSSSQLYLPNPYIYRLAVFNGVQLYNVKKVGVQFCGIISCLSEDLPSCGKPLGENNFLINSSLASDDFYISTVFHGVSIKTSPIDKGSFTFPSILELSGDPDIYGSLMDNKAFSFKKENNIGELNFFSDKLITAAIYTRVFSRDDPLPVPSSSYFTVSISIILIFLTFLFTHFNFRTQYSNN